VYADELLLRLHDRRSGKWGMLDFVGPGEVRPEFAIFAPVEVFEDGDIRLLMPLKALMVPWVARALEAPVIRTGPR
jgi:hypothetical protein